MVVCTLCCVVTLCIPVMRAPSCINSCALHTNQLHTMMHNSPHCRHSFTTLSFPPDATPLPSGLQSTAYTSSAWPGRSTISLRVRRSHTCVQEGARHTQRGNV